jgi:hypothetical protein
MSTKGLLTLLLFAVMAGSTFAQENEKRFGFELNTGVSVATQNPGETSLNTGFGFEGIVHYRFMPHLGAYVGWGWNRFGADESFAGNEVDFEETGYVLGIQFRHPFGNSPIHYFVRAGGLYNHIEIENSNGEIIHDTGHGLGWQLAGGIDLPLGTNWSFTPGLKFNLLNQDADVEGVRTELNMPYISLRIGLVKRF